MLEHLELLALFGQVRFEQAADFRRGAAQRGQRVLVASDDQLLLVDQLGQQELEREEREELLLGADAGHQARHAAQRFDQVGQLADVTLVGLDHFLQGAADVGRGAREVRRAFAHEAKDALHLAVE
jgi:hypothetical protein